MRRATAAALVVLGFAVVALQAWAFISVYFQASLDGDITYPERFARDVLAGNYPLAGWTLSSAPYFFPDFLCVIALAALAREPVVPIYAVGAAVSYAFLLGCVFRRVGWRGAGAWLAGIALVSVWFSWRHVTDHARVLWWLNGSGFHGGAVLVGLALFALWTGPVAESISRRRWVGTTVLMVLGALSDSLLVTQFIAPLGCAFVLEARRAWRVAPRLRQFFNSVVIVVVALVAWRFALRLIGGWELSGVFRYAPLPSAIAAAGEQFARDWVAEVWRNAGGFFHVGAGALVFAVILAWRARREATPERRQLAWWIVGSVVSAVVLPIVSVYWRNPQHARYLLPLLVLPPAWLIFEVQQRVASRAVRRAVTVVAIVALGLAVAWSGRDFRAGAGEYPADERTRAVAEFLERAGLQRGLADYWTAHYLTATMRGEVAFNQLRPTGAVQFWNNNGFHHFDRRGADGRLSASGYQFIVTNGLDEAALAAKFGAPTRKADVAGYLFWIFEGASGERMSAIVDAEVRARLRDRRGFERVAP